MQVVQRGFRERLLSWLRDSEQENRIMRKHLLLVSGLAAVMAVLPLTASADHRHRNHGWDHRGNWDRWDRRHYNFQRRQFRRFQNRAWRNRWYRGPRLRYDYYPLGWRSGFATGAVLGSTINVTRFHDYGDHRYCEHTTSRRRSFEGDEISGCFRVERLPDGSERRVELPRSECFR